MAYFLFDQFVCMVPFFSPIESVALVNNVPIVCLVTKVSYERDLKSWCNSVIDRFLLKGGFKSVRQPGRFFLFDIPMACLLSIHA